MQSSAGGVFAKANGALVRQLWHSRVPSNNGTFAVEWDGVDASGVPVLTHGRTSVEDFELRWVDTSALEYEWQGVVGNTGPLTGVDVQISLNPFRGTAYAGNSSVTAVGYSEGHVGTTMSPVGEPSRLIPIGHSDFRRDFSIPATDGEVGYFANTAVGVCKNTSAFWSATTWVAGWDLSSGCEHTFAAGHGDCSTCVGCQRCDSVFDGCQGHGNYFHSVIDREFDPSTVNDTQHPRKPSSKRDVDGCGTDLLRAATGLAVQRTPGMQLFIAHAYLNELRVVHKKTGDSICNVTLESPRQLAVSTDGALWVLIRNATLAKYDVRDMSAFCASRSPKPLLVLDSNEIPTPTGLISTSPKDGILAVADLNSSQVVLFSDDGRVLRRLGKPGGYNDGDPTVTPSKFFWNRGDHLWVSFQDDGTLWVMDSGNQRSLHLTAMGDFIGHRQHIPASYTTAVSDGDPTRVFSNFLEFKVGYAESLNKSWSLVRNWGAGISAEYQKDGGTNRPGFHSVRLAPDNTTIGLVHRTVAVEKLHVKRWCCLVNSTWSPSCTPCHGNADVCTCKYLNETEYVQETVLVELPSSGGGIHPLLTLDKSLAGNAMLHEGGVVRYSVTTKSEQAIFEAAYSQRNWTFPGTLISSFSIDNTTLACRVSGSTPSFPRTASGEVVVFDANDGHRPGKLGMPWPFGNHGNHLGVINRGENASWKWQSSPWGTWQVGNESETLDGINGTRYFITQATMDGRFGGNDTVQYAGSNAHVQGTSIVYGFPGEFFHNAEASQWRTLAHSPPPASCSGCSIDFEILCVLAVHFSTDGLFLGQFGTLNIGFNSAIQYALNGTSGNAYSPQLVMGPDHQIYLYHNDENAHDGVHRWLLRGASELRLSEGVGVGELLPN
jgi:hypothetical protein